MSKHNININIGGKVRYTAFESGTPEDDQRALLGWLNVQLAELLRLPPVTWSANCQKMSRSVPVLATPPVSAPLAPVEPPVPAKPTPAVPIPAAKHAPAAKPAAKKVTHGR
jgi:hypothetical protein